MGQSKWAEFHSTYSPLEISKAEPAGENTHIELDWKRASEQTKDPKCPSKVFIDGLPLSAYAQHFNNFEKSRGC